MKWRQPKLTLLVPTKLQLRPAKVCLPDEVAGVPTDFACLLDLVPSLSEQGDVFAVVENGPVIHPVDLDKVRFASCMKQVNSTNSIWSPVDGGIRTQLRFDVFALCVLGRANTEENRPPPSLRVLDEIWIEEALVSACLWGIFSAQSSVWTYHHGPFAGPPRPGRYTTAPFRCPPMDHTDPSHYGIPIPDDQPQCRPRP